MQLAIVALLIMAGFAAGVIFSSLVRAFIDKQISALHDRATSIESAAKAEALSLRDRIVALEKKI